ncbi:MAG: universal stress protein, partial [Spirochaetia bacterium]
MKMIKTILAPIDGSPASFAACNYSMKIANKLGAAVKVLFVIDQRKTQVPFMYAGGAYDITYERIYIPPDQELRDFYDRIKADLHKFSERCIQRCKQQAEELGV